MLPREEALMIIRRYIDRYNLKNENEIKKSLLKELLNKNLLIKTDDSTYTLPSYGELMHSKVGALTEAIYKFAIPSEIDKYKKPKVLDLCSGLCYNAVAALHYNEMAIIDLVEICEEVLFLSIFLDIPLKEHEIVKDKLREYFLNKKGIEYISPYDNLTINVIDAKKFIERTNKKYDIVFHDAFSPRRDNSLYRYEFLKGLYRVMNKNSKILSYSSSIPFRSGLIEAGFNIDEKESIGRKRGITLAYKNKVGKINDVDERVIALSINSIPYIDNREFIKEKLREKLKKENKYISTKKIKLAKIPNYLLEFQKLEDSYTVIKEMRKHYFGEEKILNLVKEWINMKKL